MQIERENLQTTIFTIITPKKTMKVAVVGATGLVG